MLTATAQTSSKSQLGRTIQDYSKSFVSTFDLSVIMAYVAKNQPDLIQDLASIEYQYRQFMFLISLKKYQGMSVPSVAVDKVWHAHILHTELYYSFCQNLVGHYVHHNPFSENISNEEKSKSWSILAQAFSDVFGLNDSTIASNSGCLFGSDSCDTTCDTNVCNLNCSAPDGGNTCTVA